MKIKTRQSYLNTDFKVRSDGEDDKKLYIEGYFIRYNEEINLFDNVFEEINPDAVAKSLENSDIRALFNHNSEIVLGRTGNQTLELLSDDEGLFGRIEINPNDKQAMDILARIERQDINACSFGFQILDEEIEERSDGSYKFTVKDMNLLEVSPVTFPAYPTTSISARSSDLKDFKAKKLDIRKKNLKERLKGV